MLFQYGASVRCVFCFWLNLVFFKCLRIGILNFCVVKRWSLGGFYNRFLGVSFVYLEGNEFLFFKRCLGDLVIAILGKRNAIVSSGCKGRVAISGGTWQVEVVRREKQFSFRLQIDSRFFLREQSLTQFVNIVRRVYKISR